MVGFQSGRAEKKDVTRSALGYDQRQKFKLLNRQQHAGSRKLTDSNKDHAKDLNRSINKLKATLRSLTVKMKASEADIVDLKSQRKAWRPLSHRPP